MPCIRFPGFRFRTPVAYSLLAFGLTSSLLAMPAMAQANRVKATKKSAGSAGAGFTYSGGSGVGQFQDIQVPINIQANMRGDGKAPASEFSDHLGFLLYGSAGFTFATKPLLYDLTLDLMQISALTGPTETESSSYVRANLGARARYQFRLGDLLSSVGVRLSGRRSAFDNVSNGHYIESTVAELSLGLSSPHNWQIEAYGGAAPTASFYYSSGHGYHGEQFAKSTTQLQEFGLVGSLNISDSAWFDLGFERESALVTLNDLSEYDNFGLSVTPTAESSRVYDIATTAVKLGFRQQF